MLMGDPGVRWSEDVTLTRVRGRKPINQVLCVHFWADHLTSLYLDFLVYKNSNLSEDCVENEMN